jgi:hypothetical protein
MNNDCDNKNRTGFIFLPDRHGMNYEDEDLKVSFLGTIM